MKAGELCRTIIVDDEILIRQGIKHYINWEQEGFQIVGEASNGQEALELIELTSPHIILTDIVMPIMDGEELTRIVKTKYPHIEIIILSSFGEFDYVRSTFQSGAVDYILKPKLNAQGLLKVLRTAASRIPSIQLVNKELENTLTVGQIIEKLISGYDADDHSELILKAFPNRYFCLLGVDYKRHPSKGNVEYVANINKNITKAIEKNLDHVVHYSFTAEQSVNVFLININKDQIPLVIDLANQISDSEPYIGFVLSEEFTDFSKVGMVYKESLKKLLQYLYYLPNQQILTQQALPKDSPKCSPFNLDRFTNEFMHKRFDSAFSYLVDHVTELSGCFTTDIFEYKSFFGNIIFNITILLSNLGYEVKELEDARYIYFNSIEESSTADEAVKLLNLFIEESKKCILSNRSHLDNSNIKMILQYIDEHFAEPLSLTGVAKHFHFNPSYLSNYFATHNNEGFIEYLNKIRIEEASKLLINDTITISKISEIVGYSDHSYFCKVFKKIKGLSPSQYRRKNI
ncbi:response regulator transcription factor [Metabacillus sediminilitoris]|uniref:Response regulator transcription factor n=1 Tax=Metabacillus sediminilitoris TaxID=2567941 RepID=A0A4S4BXS4_9BACI|nr:response regulator transcription factor [Metabacillus sediminilitoris]QGQ44401.1 response regulator [Metabacillus sediminilitoris]THF80024.1 response regulator transcription factor [Metabacillus sediminilitoris]